MIDEFVEAYLGIERSRLGHRLRVKVDVPEELEGIEIPPLSLQVLVENAVQHGIAPREDGGEIRIRANRSGPGENPGIVLSVDNPLAPSPRPGTGTGLEVLARAGNGREGTRLLRPEEIDALVADLGDCAAWTADGSLSVDGTLAHREERLSGSGFVRVHRKALVRLAAVRGIGAEEELVLPGGRVAVSRRRIEEIRRRLEG